MLLVLYPGTVCQPGPVLYHVKGNYVVVLPGTRYSNSAIVSGTGYI